MAELTTITAESNSIATEFPTEQSGALAIVTSPVHQGTYAFRSPWDAGSYAIKAFTASSTVYLVFALRVDVTTPPATASIYPEIAFLQTAAGLQIGYVTIQVNTNSSVGIRIINNNPFGQVGSITPMTTGVYHTIGLRVVSHATAGQMELQLDGTQVALGTGLTMTGAAALAQIKVRAAEGTLDGASGYCYTDSYIVRDDFFASFSTWEQEGYRWRNDDGTEVTATYIGAQDTPL